MAEVIEEFFVPIKKLKRGEVVVKNTVMVDPPNPKKKAAPPQKFENPKVQEWMRKNAPRKGRK